MDLIRAAATNLLELKPDVVVAIGGRVIPILMNDSSIPIIVPGGTYPVERGSMKSLARPGGNVTGIPRLNSRSSARCYRRSKKMHQMFRMLR